LYLYCFPAGKSKGRKYIIQQILFSIATF
jgi:hypothetical protein